MGWEESPFSSTTPHFFPPKEKTVNVKKEKEGGISPQPRPSLWQNPKTPQPAQRDPT
jgi:hypothetical protein